jgi:putative transposase
MQQHQSKFPVGTICQVLLVSKSGFYKWLSRKPSNRTEMNKMITQQIKQVYTASKCRYGSPRIAKELIVKGVNASEPLVAKLMAKAQLRSIIRKKFIDFQFIVGSASPK